MDLVYRIKFPDSSYASDINAGGFTYVYDYQNQPMLFFILEALRFYNFQSLNAIQKKNWTFITPETVDQALIEARASYVIGLRSIMHQLYIRRDLSKFYNKDHIKYKVKSKDGYVPSMQQFHDPAQKARFTTRIFLSNEYRTDKFVEKNPNKKKGEFRGIKLEKLVGRISQIKDEYIKLLEKKTFTVPTKYYAYWSINTADVRLGNNLIRKKPFELKEDEVTNLYQGLTNLTEHLYLHLCAPPIGPIEKWYRKGRKIQVEPRLQEVTDSLEEINNTVNLLNSFASDGFKIWNNWEKGIGILESYFMQALNTANKSNDDDIKKVGLEWALLLLSILKWFLTDLKIRTLMASLPIHTFYLGDWKLDLIDPNSYIGLCLWEALSGEELKHSSLPWGILDMELPVLDLYKVDDDEKENDRDYGIIKSNINLKGKLRNWPLVVEGKHWGSKLTVNRNELPGIDTLKSFAEKPIYISTIKNKDGKKEIKAVAIKDYPDVIGPFTPIIQRVTNTGNPERPDFYAENMTSFIRNSEVSELNFAATFQTQAHIYIVDAILRRVSSITGLDEKYKTKQEERNKNPTKEIELARKRKKLEDAIKRYKSYNKDYCRDLGSYIEIKRQQKALLLVNKFNLTAGSYLFGGKFPPHVTHKNGIHYDISMGPDVTPWQISKSTELLKLAYPWLAKKGVLKFSPDKMMAGFFKNGVYKEVCKIFDVHHFPKDTCFKKLRVTKNFMRNYENEIFEDLNGVTSDEKFKYYEEILTGTPHFQNQDDAELAHIGHLCILLSSPFRIVYASPIVHLRAIKALNRAAFLQDRLEFEESKLFKYSKLAEKITINCDYAFEPTNHHHHWHIYYWEKSNNKYNDINSFKRNKDIWLRLGIDLSGLSDYLKRYNDTYLIPDTKGCDNAKEERDALLDFLEEYNKEYQELYNISDQMQEDLSVSFVLNLFSPFVKNLDGTLLSPAAGKPKRISKLENGKKSMYNHGTDLKSHLEKIIDLCTKNMDESDDSKRVEKLKSLINESLSYYELKNLEMDVEIDPDYWEEDIMYEYWGLDGEFEVVNEIENP